MAEQKIHLATLVTNIKTCISIVLDYDGTQYNTWSTLFQLHCRTNLVIDHIIPPVVNEKEKAPETSDKALRQRLDDIVRQWIYNTISNDLLNSIIDPDDKAIDAWKPGQRVFDSSRGNSQLARGGWKPKSKGGKKGRRWVWWSEQPGAVAADLGATALGSAGVDHLLPSPLQRAPTTPGASPANAGAGRVVHTASPAPQPGMPGIATQHTPQPGCSTSPTAATQLQSNLPSFPQQQHFPRCSPPVLDSSLTAQQRGLRPPPATPARLQVGGGVDDLAYNEAEQSLSPTPHHSPHPSLPQPHPMTTHSKHGIVKPNPKYSDQAHQNSTSISPIPKNSVHALRDHNWKFAKQEEYDALIDNGT
uniref:Uncharacterized protein n=1 Tax=Chenopodium quinoa TaxID=63459 RepID=A0A803LY24_CHEQI